jgi:hypothetical protein
MTTTVKLTLSNFEVYRLFTRNIKEGANFYEQLMNKISSLLKCCKERRVEAFLNVYQMNESINRTTTYFYDEIDKLEGVLEKKKYLSGKQITFKPTHFPEVRLDSGIACSLVELFEVYDRLISQLKLIRVAGCLAHDDDYFTNLRRYFKKINRLLSTLLLTPINKHHRVTLDDVLNQTEAYFAHVALYGAFDWTVLCKAINSNAVPRIEEKIRQPLLAYLNQQTEALTIDKPLAFIEEKGAA